MVTAIDTDHGIRIDFASELEAALAAPAPTVTRHFVPSSKRDESEFAAKRTACGVEGVQDHTAPGTSTESSVTCGACKTELAKRHARNDKLSLTSLAKAPLHRSKLHGPRRWRLEQAGWAKVDGDFVVITDAGKERLAMLKPEKKAAPRKLTAAQARRVRELVEDEGNTRSEAVAYVRAFEPAATKGAA